MEFLRLFIKGGLVMYPLLLCSIIAIAILIERMKTYKKAHSDMDTLRVEIEEVSKTRNWNKLDTFCETDGGAPAKVVQEGLRQSAQGRNPEHRMEGMAMAEATKLRAYLNYLETIVTLAPLLGLLGTVVGMIGSFSVLSVSEGQPFAITGGVGEALVATATGLCVAVLALVIHTYLVQRQDRLISDIEEITTLYIATTEGDSYAH